MQSVGNIMYYYVKVKIYNKEALYDAIRKCFTGDFVTEFIKVSGPFKIIISKCPQNSLSLSEYLTKESSADNFLLTEQQNQQLHENSTMGIFTTLIQCYHEQIMLCAHSCIDRSTLQRILAGESPEYFS